MQFIREDTHLNSDTNIVIEHRGQKLLWSIQTYRTFKIVPDTVLDINQYWARRPPEIQDAIFRVYQEINEAFYTIESTDALNRRLTKLVAQLFEYHPFEDVMHYFNYHAQVKIPSDLDDNKKQKDYVKELTYDTQEYRELAGLTIVMKIMLPIWGEYLNITKTEIDSAYKEYLASTLLKESNILRSTAYARLKLYIDTYYGDSTKDHSPVAILSGLPKEAVSDWLLGNVLVRRLACSELTQRSTPGEPCVLIRHIYNFIYNISEGIDKRFGGHINEKGLERAVAGEDDNTSVLENYKIKQEISEGVILTHEIYLQQHYLNILNRLDPTCNPETLIANMKMIEKQLPADFVVEELPRAIIKWTLDPVVTAEIIEYVDWQAIMSAYCITYTLLRHWGFDHIAFMLFAQKARSRVSSNTQRLPISNKQMDVLDELYVDYLNDSRKRQRSRVRINPASNAIMTVLSNLYGTWWKLPEWENASMYPKLNITDNVTSLPYDIEPLLADLIIYLKTEIHPKLYHFDEKTGVYYVKPPEGYIPAKEQFFNKKD